MKFQSAILALALVPACQAFHVPAQQSIIASSSALFAKKRMAKKTQNVERQSQGRPKELRDAIEATAGRKKDKPEGGPRDKDDDLSPKMADAVDRMQQRPELSTMIIDEETGVEIISQGQSVLDVVTRKAVKLSDKGPDYRLAQMFPGVPPEIREKYRFDWKTVEASQMVEQLKEACSVKLEDGTQGIPPHPSVANSGLDFVLANRDLLGFKMKRTLGRLTMRAQWKENVVEAREMQALWKNFLTLENHISAPFRQMLQDAEGRVGPNFGNLDLMKFADGDLYERIGNYIVLKGMVAHWEKKVVDADYCEKTPQTPENFVSVLSRGDPKRFLPDPPILFTLKECTQVCAMAQQMCKIFVENEELFGDFPPEIVFLEEAFKVKGGTALRKFMIDDFCPSRDITPEGLREGMRRFYQQLENMQIDPYGDVTNKIDDLHQAMAVGTDDLRDPYAPYLANTDKNGPGYFQTYTFNHNKQSIVRFLDNQYPSAGNVEVGPPPPEEDGEAFDFGALFNFGDDDKKLRTEPKDEREIFYKVPEERAMGRPHELGWLDLLSDENKEKVRLGSMPAGRIIPDE